MVDNVDKRYHKIFEGKIASENKMKNDKNGSETDKEKEGGIQIRCGT